MRSSSSPRPTCLPRLVWWVGIPSFSSKPNIFHPSERLEFCLKIPNDLTWHCWGHFYWTIYFSSNWASVRHYWFVSSYSYLFQPTPHTTPQQTTIDQSPGLIELPEWSEPVTQADTLLCALCWGSEAGTKYLWFEELSWLHYCMFLPPYHLSSHIQRLSFHNYNFYYVEPRPTC